MSTTEHEALAREYRSFRHGSVVMRLTDAEPLLVRGEDRVAFLHRLTTNDMHTLDADGSLVTVLTSPTAHILFVFTVLATDDALMLLPSSGQSTALMQHLRGQIFFMDKVEVTVSDTARCRVMGATATQSLASIGLDIADLNDGDVVRENDLIVVKQEKYDVPGYELVGPSSSVDELVKSLTDAGAVLLDDDEAYHRYRIELGIPAPGFELTERYNPLEVDLGWTCSHSKGCYTGQEIIARQVNYDKVTKSLVGLLVDEPVQVGDSVLADGKPVGTVTSSTYSPHLERNIALAVIRRPHNEAGSSVNVRTSTAEVCSLPFA